MQIVDLRRRSAARTVWGSVVMVMLAAQPQAQNADLPPAYPRPGTTKLFENQRVIVWNISWLKQQYPLHRHRYDLIGVYYAPGDRMIIGQDGSRRPVTTKAWEMPFQRAGVTHVEEGTSDIPLRAVFVELKEPAASGQADTATTAPAFGAVLDKPSIDNERATAWFVSSPGGTSSHRHLRDAVVVSFTGQVPTASFVTRGTMHAADGTAGADRVYVFELK